ncbi:CLUMA_CG012072, isoform A [Clunio marinus]|uniref:CLUMA_CG012072, isoform A n=1 Tax=Clunio marinus TaxID=568069 RepID=A0A1J1IH00_9DIPT|nr:CLUMA_CG012072, isoform A [Clunio marinus]
MDEKEYKSLIFISGLDKFYNTMNMICVDAIGKFGNSNFRFLNGISLIFSNRIQEGIRELNSLTSDSDVGIGSMLSLIYGHKKCSVVDKEAVGSLEARIKEERKRLTPNSAYYASLFLFLCGKYEKARDYAEKTLKLHNDHTDSMILKGWCEIMLNQKTKSTLELFNKAVSTNETIDGILGQVRFHQNNNDFEKAISILNRLSVRYPHLNVPLVEKMKTYLASWDYEQAYETSYRILNMEPYNIEALRTKTIVVLCRDGKIDESVECLQTLYKALEKHEPSNSEIYYEIAQLFSKCCGRNQKVLSETYKFAEKSNTLSPTNSNYLTELGFQSVLLKQLKNAVKFFRNATKIDDNSMQALCGLTLCQLLDNGHSTQVSQQIEFLTEIQGTSNKSPLLLFLTAKLLHDKPKEAIASLIEACEVHFKNLKTLSFGAEYLRAFDPDFLLELCKELLQYCPIQQSITMKTNIPRETLHVSLKNSINILETVVKALPGSCEALFNLARVQFLSGEVAASALSLQKILQEIDPTFTPAHLLIAQIHIQQNNHQRASQSLEICLSHDFKIRDNPLYHLIFGIVLKAQQNFEECLKSFKMAMTICGYYNVTNSDEYNEKSSKTSSEKIALGLADLVTLFLEMINTYTLMNEHSEAAKLMQFAMKEFEKTPESGRVIIANADFYLSQGNTIRSLELLSSIHPGQSYYLQAKTKMANIYLVNKKDRLSFAQCFRELVHNNPGPDSYIMLGDAYMSIQEPDEAVEAYKQAVLQDPMDPSLASKLGRAYVKTHQYKKAIEYYKDVITVPDNYQLKLDLAELYLKLKQYSNAEKIILDDIEKNQRHDDDLSKLQTKTKLLLLLSRVREKSGNINASLSSLKEARDNQYRIQQRISIDQNANVHEQHKILSKICALMAEQSIMIRDNVQAIQHYKEAIKFSPHETTQQASLAKLYMQLNRMQECQNICAMILENDPNDENAQIMMADLSFRRMDFESAAYHFSQLVLSKPTYWTALARLIEVMRRSGSLNESLTFIEQAEEKATSGNEAGLSFCKGLFDWYTCNPNGALRHFNNSRRDVEWGKQSVFNMIEICLNPDADLPSEGELSDVPEDVDINNSRSIALKTAERLLKELKPKTNVLDNEALNHKLLENFLLLATRQKVNVEKALNNFTAIVSQDEFKENVGAIYGIAGAHVMLKQGQRAKNQLKRINKSIWTFEEAEYLERSWLLLADIYIQASKYDIATDLLQKVLKHNKSCYKAYELCGQISEKEQNYKSAAIHYENAWKFSGKQKPNIAHKLAYNSMKSKRFADAIDVCQQALKIYPDYPSVKEILEKSRNNLKM